MMRPGLRMLYSSLFLFFVVSESFSASGLRDLKMRGFGGVFAKAPVVGDTLDSLVLRNPA